MQFIATKFAEVWLLDPDRLNDERGFFARTWCQREFADRGLACEIVQCNVSFNRSLGTLRGMHFQKPPHDEGKFVRCTQGAIFDVVVDIRAGSDTFGQWQGFELTADNRHTLYIPQGYAHGFQTLSCDTEVFYQMTNFYDSQSASGFHHADVEVGIQWPLPVGTMSPKDAEFLSLAATCGQIQPPR